MCVPGLFAPGATGADASRVAFGDLVIRVTGVGAGRGAIHYALYNSAKYFPKQIGHVAEGRVPAKSAGNTIVIKGVMPGYYAVAVFHDENLNDEFDQGLFDIPLEDYGFSNDARGFFSAPSFNDAKFRVRGPRTEISIKLGK
jgi:uncharacterized protein (DUF2141 family)